MRSKIGPSLPCAGRILGRSGGKLPWRRAAQEPHKLSSQTINPKGTKHRDENGYKALGL